MATGPVSSDSLLSQFQEMHKAQVTAISLNNKQWILSESGLVHFLTFCVLSDNRKNGKL